MSFFLKAANKIRHVANCNLLLTYRIMGHKKLYYMQKAMMFTQFNLVTNIVYVIKFFRHKCNKGVIRPH